MGFGSVFGPTIILVSAFVGLCVLNAILAELASWKFERRWLWLLLFFLVPGISHLFFLYLLYYDHRKKRALRILKAVSDLPRRVMPGEEASPFEAIDGISVTPFSELEDAEKTSVEPGYALVNSEWRDRRIDELMEWEQWEKALERADECLTEAQDAGDRRSIELYEAYLTLLRGRVLGLETDLDSAPPMEH